MHEILYAHLNVRKVVAKWVPKVHKADMKQTRVKLTTKLFEMANNTHSIFSDDWLLGRSREGFDLRTRIKTSVCSGDALEKHPWSNFDQN